MLQPICWTRPRILLALLFLPTLPILLIPIVSHAVEAPSSRPAKTSAASKQASTELVHRALQAELDGDLEGRRTYLAVALKQDPSNSLARWHNGYIKHEKQWLSVDRASSINAGDEALSKYQFLRERYSGNLQGEISMARWCRLNDLEDREKLHWQNVIKLDRTNEEAHKRLKLRVFNGQLMPKDQVDELKQASRDYQRSLRVWGPRIIRLRRQLDSSTPEERKIALERLGQITDAEAAASLEKQIRLAKPTTQIHLIDALGNIKGPLASDALVRLSIHLKEEESRTAAAESLSAHSLHAYVPQYLQRLESPIEYFSTLTAYGDLVTSHTRMTQERPDEVVTIMQSTNAGLTVVGDPEVRQTAAYRQIVARETQLQNQKIATTERSIEAKNAQARQLNEKVFAALRHSTGEELEDIPKSWWEWWKRHNEYLVPENKREYFFTNTELRQRTLEVSPPQTQRHECFPAGTIVHTETGPRAIESVKRGDRVLSRDVETGELSFKLVMDTTVRPPSDTMQFEVAGERVIATLGHPFWVVGNGWTMAKDLNPGDRLHGIDGSHLIEVIEGGPKVEAHNLIISETNSYFVGETGFLVHDNEMRAASTLPVPGWNGE